MQCEAGVHNLLHRLYVLCVIMLIIYKLLLPADVSTVKLHCTERHLLQRTWYYVISLPLEAQTASEDSLVVQAQDWGLGDICFISGYAKDSVCDLGEAGIFLFKPKC